MLCYAKPYAVIGFSMLLLTSTPASFIRIYGKRDSSRYSQSAAVLKVIKCLVRLLSVSWTPNSPYRPMSLTAASGMITSGLQKARNPFARTKWPSKLPLKVHCSGLDVLSKAASTHSGSESTASMSLIPNSPFAATWKQIRLYLLRDSKTDDSDDDSDEIEAADEPIEEENELELRPAPPLSTTNSGDCRDACFNWQ